MQARGKVMGAGKFLSAESGSSGITTLARSASHYERWLSDTA